MNEMLPAWVGAWNVPTSPVVLGTLFLLVATLVNVLAPARRARLRTTTSLYGLHLALTGVTWALEHRGLPAFWWSVGGAVAAGFTLVQLASLTVFDVLLPRTRWEPHRLASDLALALGYGISIVAALASHGFDLSSVLAASTVFAAVLTVSLQATLGNVIGGVAVQLDGVLQPGQWVQLENGRQGRIREIRWRYSLLETRDGDTLLVPNASLLTGQLTLLGRRDALPHPHRVAIQFQVDFEHAPAHVCRLVEDAVRVAVVDNVAAEPAPDCICLDFGREHRDGVAHYALRFWVVDVAREDPTASRVRAVIHTVLRRAGIPLGEPAERQIAGRPPRALDADAALARARETVRSLELFAHLTEAEAAQVGSRLVFAPFCAGEAVTRQGSTAHYLYIVQEGACEVRVNVNGEQRLVARIDAPGFFGEMGLMTGQPRLASVIAVTDVECYRLDKAAFHDIIRARPEIAAHMAQVLASRRVQLLQVRDGLDASQRQAAEPSERDRIVTAIRTFFGID